MVGRAALWFAFLACLGGCFPDRPTDSSADAPRVAAPALPLPAPRPPPQPSGALSGVGRLPLAPCGNSEDGFEGWLQTVRRNASALGISPRTIREALETAHYDADVVALDRDQKPLKLTFAAFLAKRMTPKRIARGRRAMAEQHDLLARIGARFGVQSEVLVALWGLESDYGAYMGKTPSIQALVTLAYDCRRAPRFRDELMSALRIVERRDLEVDEMYGAWAGELGQTQFLPSSYEEFGVDFDGDGRVDMIRSSADALASTARYLEAAGWRRGEPYQPDSPNFAALRTWNASEMYRKVIVVFASKLAEE